MITRQQRIEEQVEHHFQPSYLLVENESNKHHVPQGSETHFKLIVVAKHFINLSKINRHKSVQKLLADEFTSGLHALSLNLYSPDEWQNLQNKTFNSPNCRDGYKHG